MVISDATQAGWKFGMEEVGAIDDWKLPTCAPHTGLACLVRPVAILITGEISNFLEFYTFVGCVVLLFNPILMVNVEVLWMFSQPPQMIILILDLIEKLKTPHTE